MCSWAGSRFGRRRLTGSSLLTQLHHLFLPALALVIVYFGYIARITRAGMIKALDADYTRTATMKGLSNRQILNRHVLRNGLQPTVAVVGIQIGYLFGSLVALEIIFSYPGIGSTIFNAASSKDLPVLQAAVILVGIIYMLTTLAADLTIAWMNPRARVVAAEHVTTIHSGLGGVPDEPADLPQDQPALAQLAGAGAGRAAPGPQGAVAAAPPAARVHHRLRHLPVLARVRHRRRPHHAVRPDQRPRHPAPAARAASTGSAPTTSAVTCSRG